MIEVKIKKNYPDFRLDIAFTVEKEVLALFGPSGSGKSTTFQCISGLLKPDEGYICLNGRVVFDSQKGINILPRERRVGYIFQNYALFPHMTVRNNISFGMFGMTKKEAKKKVDYLLDMMRLGGLGDRYPRQISGGQQQRVALARALAMEPELLLMDEPFSALDSNVKEELEREILEINKHYQGEVLLITHNLAEAYKLSSKIAVYQSGRIVQKGPKAEIMNNPRNKKVAFLTGLKNFMEGQVDRVKDDGAIIKTSLGNFFAAPGSGPVLRPGDKVILGIRPEYVTVRETQGANTLAARITRVVDGISACFCEFTPDQGPDHGEPLCVEMPKTRVLPYEAGQECFLYFPPEKIALMTD